MSFFLKKEHAIKIAISLFTGAGSPVIGSQRGRCGCWSRQRDTKEVQKNRADTPRGRHVRHRHADPRTGEEKQRAAGRDRPVEPGRQHLLAGRPQKPTKQMAERQDDAEVVTTAKEHLKKSRCYLYMGSFFPETYQKVLGIKCPW